MTFEFIVAGVFVVAAFVLGYTGGKNGYTVAIRKALELYSRDIERKYNERLGTEIDKAVRAEVEEYLKSLNKKEQQARQKKQQRLLKNREFEASQPAQWRIQKCREVSEDAFKLWALLTSNYSMERSLELDGQIQAVCQRITDYLLPHEVDVLFQIDRETCDEALHMYHAIDDIICNDEG